MPFRSVDPHRLKQHGEDPSFLTPVECLSFAEGHLNDVF